MKIEKIGEIGKISQIAITVSDLERSIAFYGETLGFPLLFQAPPQMAFFDCHGIRLLIGQGEVNPGGPILYFSVDDIDTAWKDIGDNGAEQVRSPQMTHKTETSELWLAVFKDPDGHLLELLEERAV